MITGFNTDIEFEGVTYHVQTEDKGLETPLILSLVYQRGTILASKRSPYEDLLDNFSEKELAERLQRQHQLICAAIRAGRIEDLKRMTMKESAARQKGLVAQKEIIPPPEQPVVAPAQKNGKAVFDIPVPQLLDLAPNLKKKPSAPFGEKKLELPNNLRIEQKIPPAAPIAEPVSEPIIEAVKIIEEEIILPAEAVEIITDVARTEVAGADRLHVELMGDFKFKGGERKTVSLLVRRGSHGEGLSGAQVMVKVLGSAFRPLIFHAKTDSNGIAVVNLHFPHFNRGRAAMLVKAMSGGEEAELRRIVRQG